MAIYNGSDNGRPDWHLYWSFEPVFGGKGASRGGLKLIGWYQDGERAIHTSMAQQKETLDRKRYGVGATLRRGPWRAAAE